MVPEGRVIALGRVVVQDDEVAHLLELGLRAGVETVDIGLFETGAREHLQQFGDAGLDQVDRGRFQGFDEARGQADGDAVLHPGLFAPPGDEADQPRIGQRLAVQIGQQCAVGLVVGNVGRRVDIAIADPVLQRDAPLPARFTRRGPRVGREGLDTLARHGQSPVAGQPVGPVLIAGLQRLLDQQAAEAGTVDEELALDGLPALQLDRADEAAFRILVNLDDLALLALHAAFLGEATQILGIEMRIEMEGVGDVGQR